MYDLNTLVPFNSGILLGEAVGINDSGQIVANGCFTAAGGECHAFLLEPVPNQPPTANAGPDQTVQVGRSVTLNGNGSVDSDGGPGPLQYAWSQTGGAPVSFTNPNTVAPGFTAPTPGVYTFSLVVGDGQESSAPDSVTVTVKPSVLGNVAISATDNIATEAGRTTGRFTLTRTGSTALPLTVHYTVGGTAIRGKDYVALPGRRTIPAGSATATIIVTPINDRLMEGNETVVLQLAPSVTYTVGSPSRATVRIISNERVTISATDNTATEAGRTTGRFTLTRTGSTALPLTVHYTVGGTAIRGKDYVALAGSRTIPAGSSTATIIVTPINDTLMEVSETVVLQLAPSATYTVGSPSRATVTIISNERGAQDASYTFTTIDVPGASVTYAVGVNQGQIVGYFDGPSGRQVFLKNGPTFTTFGVPGASVTEAWGINSTGQIVGTFQDASGEHGFLATPGLW